MNHRTFAIGLALAFAALGGTGCATAQAPAKDQMVLQMSDADPAKWNLALNNVKNVQNELGKDKVAIEIVAFGPGIGMLKADALTANRVNEAVQSGIQVVACENTMKTLNLTAADMNPAVTYVPAGVVEIMRRQQQGWAYIRP